MSVSNDYKTLPASIEVRSIDYVPDGERHGGLASQFTLWLATHPENTSIGTGGPSAGFWGGVVLVIGGTLVGSVDRRRRHGAPRGARSAARFTADDLLPRAVRHLWRGHTDRGGVPDVHRLFRQWLRVGRTSSRSTAPCRRWLRDRDLQLLHR